MIEFLTEHIVQITVSLVIIAAAAAVYRGVRRAKRKFGGLVSLLLTAAGEDELCEQKPKSLSGFDKLLLPKILRDFPDFNLSMVKGEIADYIKKNLSDKDGLLIHNIVINKYNVTGIEREIVFQAAVQHLVDGKTVQSRFNVCYLFSPEKSGDGTVAANCPNCGAPVSSPSARVCEYCSSPLHNVLGNIWRVTQMYES